MTPSTDHARKLYQALSGAGALALEPDDPAYVPILEGLEEKDPILRLALRIELAQSESVDLLTGFRGNGKSTQLRRLKRHLQEQGCHVFLVDMIEYVFMTKPIELTDFLLSLTAALAVQAEEDAGLRPLSRSYIERMVGFLRSEVELGDIELGLEAGVEGGPKLGAKLGMRLKTDAIFKEQLQAKLKGRATRVVDDGRSFVSEMVDAIRKKSKDRDKKVVVLVDSMEQLRGVGTDGPQVHKSVLELFSGEAANLSFPKLHVVYTIPPYLLPLSQNLGRSLGGHPISVWPNIHVRNQDGTPDPKGLSVTEQLVERRYPDWSRVLSRKQLHRLAESSGGDIRDYFRLVREAALTLSVVRASRPEAAMTEDMLADVEQVLRNELLPGSDQDVKWLEEIHRTKRPSLSTTEELPALARFLDGNLIMNYSNGEPWNDVHPLLVDQVRRAERRGRNKPAMK